MELSHLFIHGLVIFLCLFQKLLETSWWHVLCDENDLQTEKTCKQIPIKTLWLSTFYIISSISCDFVVATDRVALSLYAELTMTTKAFWFWWFNKEGDFWDDLLPSLCSLWHQPSTCGTSQCSNAPAGSNCQKLLWPFPVETMKEIKH